MGENQHFLSHRIFIHTSCILPCRKSMSLGYLEQETGKSQSASPKVLFSWNKQKLICCCKLLAALFSQAISMQSTDICGPESRITSAHFAVCSASKHQLSLSLFLFVFFTDFLLNRVLSITVMNSFQKWDLLRLRYLINVINVQLCMVVLLSELYLFTPLSLTLIRSVTQ